MLRRSFVLTLLATGCGAGAGGADPSQPVPATTSLADAGPIDAGPDIATGEASVSFDAADGGSDARRSFDPIWGYCAPRHWSIGAERFWPGAHGGPKLRVSDTGGGPTLKLPDDRLLIAASAYIYDPTLDDYFIENQYPYPRGAATMLQLSDGRSVLLAGGSLGDWGAVADVDILDVPLNKVRHATPMNCERSWAKATMLPNGKALVYGGVGNEAGNDVRYVAEVYDPITDRWNVEPAPKLQFPSDLATSTLTSLSSGDVLITGGQDAPNCGQATIYRWSTDSWERAASMPKAFAAGESVLLNDGRVLVTGGRVCGTEPPAIVADAALFDPSTGAWHSAHPMNHARYVHSMITLPCGSVIAFGGYGWGADGNRDPNDPTPETHVEIYDPVRDAWTDLTETPYYVTPRSYGQLLKDGRAVVTYGLLASPASGESPYYRPLFLSE